MRDDFDDPIDSDPDFEYQETLHKARGMKLALEAVLAGV